MTQPPDTTRPGFSVIAAIGGLLVGIGAVILAFVLFMVFGTALIQGSHQQSLRTEFERVFPAPGHTAPGPPRTVAAATPPPLGAPVAQIQIPAISPYSYPLATPALDRPIMPAISDIIQTLA